MVKELFKMEDKRERQKLDHMTFVSLKSAYEDVVQIHVIADAIAYDTEHYDFAVMAKDSLDMVIIPCQNRHCTSGYFYLNEKITFALARKEREIEGEIKCSGSDSENHRHQSCRGVLKYRVEITYE